MLLADVLGTSRLSLMLFSFLSRRWAAIVGVDDGLHLAVVLNAGACFEGHLESIARDGLFRVLA